MYLFLFFVLGISIKVLDDLLDIYEIPPCSPLAELLKSIVIVLPTILLFGYKNPWTAPMLFVLSIGFALLVPDEYLDQDIWASGTLLSLFLTVGFMYKALKKGIYSKEELIAIFIIALAVPSIGCGPDFLASLYKTLNLNTGPIDSLIRQEVGYTKLFLRAFSIAFLVSVLPLIKTIQISQGDMQNDFHIALRGYIYLWIAYFFTSCINQVYMLTFSDSYSTQKEEQFLQTKRLNLDQFNYLS